MLFPQTRRVIPGFRYQSKRPIPAKAEIAVRLGQVVWPSTPIARITMPPPAVRVPAATLLGVSPNELANHLVKRVGDRVSEGELLARRGGYIRGKREVLSPVSGIIDFIFYDAGEVSIARPVEVKVIAAETIGQVNEIALGQHILIETPAAIIEGICCAGPQTHGRLKVLAGERNAELGPEDVAGDCRDCILVSGSIAGDEAILAAKRSVAAGLILGGAPAHGHDRWLGSSPEIPLTIALTEGFGASAMNSRVFDLLRDCEGRTALIQPDADGQAKIIIMLSEGADTRSPLPPTLGVGSRVRIVSRPYFGVEGRVAELPPSPQTLPSGVVAKVARIDLAERLRVTVPVANIELVG